MFISKEQLAIWSESPPSFATFISYFNQAREHFCRLEYGENHDDDDEEMLDALELFATRHRLCDERGNLRVVLARGALVRVCVYACMHVCVYACMCACVHARCLHSPTVSSSRFALLQHKVPRLFERLTSLTRLALVHTRIESVSNLQSLVNLKQLDLSSSPLRDISELSANRALEQLVLDFTLVAFLPPCVFRHLTSLRWLSMRSCFVRDLPLAVHSLQLLPALEVTIVAVCSRVVV